MRRSSDDAPATCVMPSSRTQPAEPNSWKLKPGPVAVSVPRYPDDAVAHAEQHRGGVVVVDLDHAAEALAVHLGDLAAEVDHAVDGVDAHRREPAAGRLVAPGAPWLGLSVRAFGKVIVASACMTVPSSPERDPLAQLRHLWVEAAVVAEPERDPGANACFGRLLCLAPG